MDMPPTYAAVFHKFLLQILQFWGTLLYDLLFQEFWPK